VQAASEQQPVAQQVPSHLAQEHKSAVKKHHGHKKHATTAHHHAAKVQNKEEASD